MPGRQHLARLFPPLRIAGRIYLTGLLVLLLAFLLTATAAWIMTGDQAQAYIDSNIDADLQSFQTDLEQETRDLSTLGNWLATQPTLVDLVRNRDRDGLTRYLLPLTQGSIVDSLVVADDQGLVLARVRTDQTLSQGDNISDLPGVAQALHGQRATGLDRDTFGRLQEWLILPISQSSQVAPNGVVMLSFFLDGGFFNHLITESPRQLAIVFQNEIQVSNLRDAGGKQMAGTPAPPEVQAAERAGSTVNPIILQYGGRRYLFRFKPLLSPSNSTVGMYGAGALLDAVEAQHRALFSAFGLALLAALAGTIIVGYLLARGLVQPIHLLYLAAQKMAGGDLSTNIALHRWDELGELAREMDAMRQRLHWALQDATLEKSRYEAVIQSMGVAAIVTNRDGKIVAVNPAAQAVLQETRVALIGRCWDDIFQGQLEPGPQTGSDGNGAHADATPVLRTHVRSRAQPQMVLEAISARVQVGSQSEGFVHVLRDDSARDQLIQAKDEFMLNVAHELRGPLASLRSFIELLREDYDSLGKRDSRLLLQALERAIIRFQRLVENLIDIGSIQAGQFRVRPIPTPVDRMVRDATAQVESILKANEQRLEVSGADPSITVLADAPRAVQVLVNFLSNASKYGPENETIGVQVTAEERRARIAVTDHGAGISAQELPHIFERFYRTKRAETEGIGIGIGLALSRAIIEAHGGEIGVISEVGQGSTFWFTLPLVQPAAGSQALPGPAEEAGHH